MRLETFHGRDLASVCETARRALGEDVMIIGTRSVRHEGMVVVELTAASAQEVERFQRRLESPPFPAAAERRHAGGGSLKVALVGPTGAGKTTTAAKLALHPRGFGEQRVGLLTLDTYRVGALEQLSTLAEIAGLPLEVVYHPSEMEPALRRLAHCDVVLIDTPGRSPRSGNLTGELMELLAAAAPDEVHLVLPATVRLDVAEAARRDFDRLGLTHLLLSKLDEVPEERGLAELAEVVGLPARWVTDGQEVPTDLRGAGGRILASLSAGFGAVGARRGAA